MFAEWRGHRTGDPALHELAHTWAKAMGVLFAAGAVSGTLLTFEMGILWPGLMNTYGEIFGFPFVLEGFAFFIEAIFVGIYLFGWNRLSPRAHILCAVPMILAGMAGTFFVVAANAWMNNPVGFDVAPDGHADERRPDRAACSPRRCRRRSPTCGSRRSWSPGSASRRCTPSACCAGARDGGHRDRYHRYGHAHPADRRGGRSRRSRSGSATGSPTSSRSSSRPSSPRWRRQYETQAERAAVARRHLLRRRAALRPRGPLRPVAADPPRPRRRGGGPGGGPRAGPAAGQRRAPGLQHDGRRRLGAAAARARVRLRDVEAALTGSRTCGSCGPWRCPGCSPWPRWRPAGSPPRSGRQPWIVYGAPAHRGRGEPGARDCSSASTRWWRSTRC